MSNGDALVARIEGPDNAHPLGALRHLSLGGMVMALMGEDRGGEAKARDSARLRSDPGRTGSA